MKLTQVAAIFFFAIAVTSGAAKAETLADALRDAYHNSGLLDQNRALLRAADEDVAQSMAALRPIITYQAGLTYATNSALPDANLSDEIDASLSVTASLLLYDAGASAAATEAQKEIVLQTRQGLIALEQQVLLKSPCAEQNFVWWLQGSL